MGSVARFVEEEERKNSQFVPQVIQQVQQAQQNQKPQAASVAPQKVITGAVAQTPQGPQGPPPEQGQQVSPQEAEALMLAAQAEENNQQQQQEQQGQAQAVEEAQTRASTGQAQQFDNILLALDNVAQGGGLVGKPQEPGNPNLQTLLSAQRN
tara:strand:+ start:53 stop:511 length:459 start_codon:yes stop_codon:yes gene_type:complete